MDNQFHILAALAVIVLMLSIILVIEKRNEALLDLLVKRSPTCYETPR